MTETAITGATIPGDRDRTVLARAARGETAAFEELVATRLDRVYRLAFAILRTEADATDIAQQAFITAWRGLPRLRDRDRFDAWLSRIVVNLCRDELRRRGRHALHEIPIEVDEDRAVRPESDDLETHVGRSDEIRRAFSRLNAAQRSILVLHHVDGQSIDEIATTLAIPTGTAKWRLFAARQALERALQEEAR